MIFTKIRITEYIYFSLVLLLFTPVLSAYDTPLDLEKYVLRTWVIQSGLPQNTITSLEQTYDGYIWIGTTAGLARFDGIKFKTFLKENSPLQNNRITCLFEDSNQVLWIGTHGGGLYSYRDGNWKNYNTEEGLSNPNIRVIIEDWKGNLWIGTDYGLNQLKIDIIVQVFTTKNGLYDNIITDLTIDNSGNLWIGSLQGGLAFYFENVFTTFGYNEGLSNISVLSLTADHLGNIWIGTMAGLYFLKENEWIIRSVPGTHYTPITSIFEDSERSLWVGTMSAGLKRIFAGLKSELSAEKGLPDNYIRCLLIDRDNNIWIGTDKGGLVQLKKPQVKNISRENGLPENTVYTVMEDSKGFVWVGTRNSGLCKFKDTQTKKTFNIRSGISSNKVRALLEDRKGGIWIGTEDRGISILQNGRITQLKSNNGLYSNKVNAFLQDKDGVIWIGTDKGLNRFKDGKIEIGNKSKGILNCSIQVLLEGFNGFLYVGTNEGLFQVSGKTMKTMNISDTESSLDVAALFQDKNGVLWVGTNGSGLKRLDEGKILSFTTEEGLRDNYIFSIIEDNNGNLWMSSNKGVFYINPKGIKEDTSGYAIHIFATFFDETDGMFSSQCIGEGQPSGWKTASGRLLYPTGNGVAILYPENIPVRTTSPEVFITDIRLDNISIQGKKDSGLLPKSEIIEFFFTALDFSAPEKLHFQYKLEGYDNKFVNMPFGLERFTRYVNLDPGKYRFIVKAFSNNRIWSEKDAVFEFEILFPFYQKPIFYILLGLILFSLMGLLLYMKQQKKIKKHKDKYKTLAVDPERVEEVLQKLLFLMEKEKLFLDPGLTLNKLAGKLRIHYNHLSRIINEKMDLSYNDFINKYRIQEATNKLSDPKEKDSTILDILYNSGFYSKSVFNTAFKKFTGLTPSEYRKKHR
jgi:ligand-binding sensor domain-containing protein/AraC-like DNA-binding protein